MIASDIAKVTRRWPYHAIYTDMLSHATIAAASACNGEYGQQFALATISSVIAYAPA